MALKKVCGLVAAVIFAVAFALLGYGYITGLINGLGSLGALSPSTILLIALYVAWSALSVWGLVYVILTAIKFFQNKLDEDAIVKAGLKLAFIFGLLIFVASAGWFVLELISGGFVWQFLIPAIFSLVGFISVKKGSKVAAIVGLCALLLALIICLVYESGMLAVYLTAWSELYKADFIFALIAVIANAVILFLPAAKTEATTAE